MTTKTKIIIVSVAVVALSATLYFTRKLWMKGGNKEETGLDTNIPTNEDTKTNTTTVANQNFTFPLKTEAEGNAFRAWINDKYPAYAKEIDLDRAGKLNKFVQKAWDKYGAEYQKATVPEKPTATVVKTESKKIYAKEARTPLWSQLPYNSFGFGIIPTRLDRLAGADELLGDSEGKVKDYYGNQYWKLKNGRFVSVMNVVIK